MKNTTKQQLKRTLIMNTVIDMIKKSPEQEISMSAIAHQLGIGKASLYYYFSSKYEILEAIVEQFYKSNNANIDRIRTDTSWNALEKMEKILATYSSHLQSICHFSRYLNRSENIAIKSKLDSQKSQASYSLYEYIILQGLQEQLFHCARPVGIAHHISNLMETALDYVRLQKIDDYGIQQLLSLEEILESVLHCESGAFSFVHRIITQSIGTQPA